MFRQLIRRPINLLNNNRKQFFSNGVNVWDVVEVKQQIENIRFWCMSTTFINALIGLINFYVNIN